MGEIIHVSFKMSHPLFLHVCMLVCTHTHTLANFCIFVFMKDLCVLIISLWCACYLHGLFLFTVCCMCILHVCVCVCICDHVCALPCIYGVCVHVYMPLDCRLFVHPIHSLSIHFA